jgi:signal transduction histidine kinase
MTAADGLPAGEIAGLFVDHSGRLWIGSSQGGLARADDPTAERPRLVTYTTADGLASMNVRCITEDQWGRLYIGTTRGVNRFEPSTGRIKHYTKGDGLAGELITAFRDRQGRLWFATFHSLALLVPQPDPPALPPPVFIGGLHIAGVSYPISALGEIEVPTLELTASQNPIRIDFFGLSFGLGEALRYQYRMEGTDQDWSLPTDQRTLHYLRLHPGAYRFMVRAVNTDGLTSATPAVVTFSVLPPIWQRWWFILLVAMGMSFLVYAFYHYRVARLIELERVRTRIATDLHDDVGSSLSQVAILGEVAKQQIQEAPLGAAATMTEITETARAVIDAMSDIVWSIDPRRDDLSNLVIRIRKFATNLFEGQGIVWDFQTPSELEKIKLTPEQRRHLFLIFKEAIHNIVRHAGATAVTLHLAVADHQLTAEIRDNGRGFTPPLGQESAKPERQGYGLSSMQARAAQLGGHLTVDAAPSHGVRLTLRVPLKG